MFSEYDFRGGFPTPETIELAYDDSDLCRAIEAYKFFFPTVSIAAMWKGDQRIGLSPNAAFLLLRGTPRQTVLTPASDTPCAVANLDLSAGPVVVDLPSGPLLGVVNDLHQRHVADLGVSGPDGGRGGRHLILSPTYQGRLPRDFHASRSSTNRALLMLRGLPREGDLDGSLALLRQVKLYPFAEPKRAGAGIWLDIGNEFEDFTAHAVENDLGFWRDLHEIIDSEPPYEPYRMQYGMLASLGIEKGQPFEPDARMADILQRAARMANAQMRVQSFADRRADRITWPDRHWEWAGKRPEPAIWDLPSYRDLEAREKWFYQASTESPALFRRDPGAGSLHWLSARDSSGAYLDGGRTYRLVVPLPVPAKLFWSVTVYDPDTRSEIVTPQGRAALRSLFELQNVLGSKVELHFGPTVPRDKQQRWVQTLTGKGWFAYFRIHAPQHAAFDGSWRPGDFECVD
jgi:hypothetical protein